MLAPTLGSCRLRNLNKFQKIFCQPRFVQAAAIEAASDAVAFNSLACAGKRQMASGDGVAERIGALRPVGRPRIS
jgi:hypothetical protein